MKTTGNNRMNTTNNRLGEIRREYRNEGNKSRVEVDEWRDETRE